MKRSVLIASIAAAIMGIALAGCGADVKVSGDPQNQKEDLIQTGEEKTNKTLVLALGEDKQENVIVVDPVEGDEFAGQWNFAPENDVTIMNTQITLLAKGCRSMDIESGLFWAELNEQGEVVDGAPFPMAAKVTAKAGKKYALIVTLNGIKDCKRVVVKTIAEKV